MNLRRSLDMLAGTGLFVAMMAFAALYINIVVLCVTGQMR